MTAIQNGVAAIALLASGAGMAQQAPQPQPQPSAKPAPVASPDQVVCERQEDIGTRLSSHKICHTRSQWAQIRRDDRSALERAQSQRGVTDLNGH